MVDLVVDMQGLEPSLVGSFGIARAVQDVAEPAECLGLFGPVA